MFDKKRFSTIIKESGYTTKSLFDRLKTKNIKFEISTLEAYRKGTIKSPPIENLEKITEVLNCSIQDFFTDADEKREKIAFEELSKQPEKYSNSALSSLPKTTQDIINNLSLLTEAQKKEILEQVKEIAHQGKPKL